MAKVKLTYESAKDKLAGVKEELPAAESQLKEYVKKNKVKGGKSEDKKTQAGHDKIVSTIADLKERKARYIAFMRENKPQVDRESKYKYPVDCKTGLDKKKFRSVMRSKAKRAKVDIDVYLADPGKYDKLVAAKDAEKSAKKEKPKAKKKVKEAPKKKLKVVDKKKKKATPPPDEEEEVEEIEGDSDEEAEDGASGESED